MVVVSIVVVVLVLNLIHGKSVMFGSFLQLKFPLFSLKDIRPVGKSKTSSELASRNAILD